MQKLLLFIDKVSTFVGHAFSWLIVALTLLIGSYAVNYYLKDRRKKTLNETVAAWRDYLPEFLPLPHPSWRNTGWLKKNPWFERDLVPELRKRVKTLVG